MPELRPGRPEAAAAIWSWRGEAGSRVAPSRRPVARARARGLLQGMVGAAVGAGLHALGYPRIGVVALSLGTGIALAALASPTALYAAIEQLFGATGRLVGRALSWIILPMVFYGFFVPFHWLFRTGRRDAMKRFFETEATSYWSARERARAGSDSRERQY